jgi:Fe-S oxidoreductase
LQSIPGLKLVEMPNNRERSVCCGGGGGGAWSNDFLNQRFGELRVQEALNIGAEEIATACPYCIRMLNEAMRELRVENKIVVRDLAELLLQSLPGRDEAMIPERVEPGFDQEVCHV